MPTVGKYRECGRFALNKTIMGARVMTSYFDKAIAPIAWVSLIAIMFLGLLIY